MVDGFSFAINHINSCAVAARSKLRICQRITTTHFGQNFVAGLCYKLGWTRQAPRASKAAWPFVTDASPALTDTVDHFHWLAVAPGLRDSLSPEVSQGVPPTVYVPARNAAAPPEGLFQGIRRSPCIFYPAF